MGCTPRYFTFTSCTWQGEAGPGLVRSGEPVHVPQKQTHGPFRSFPQVEQNHHNLDILQDFFFSMSREDFDMAWSVLEWPQQVQEAVFIAKFKLEAANKRMQVALDKEKEQFGGRLEDLNQQVQTARPHDLARTHCTCICWVHCSLTSAVLLVIHFFIAAPSMFLMLLPMFDHSPLFLGALFRGPSVPLLSFLLFQYLFMACLFFVACR